VEGPAGSPEMRERLAHVTLGEHDGSPGVIGDGAHQRRRPSLDVLHQVATCGGRAVEVPCRDQHVDRRAKDDRRARGIAVLGKHPADEGGGGTDVALREAQEREARAGVMASRRRVAIGLIGESELPSHAVELALKVAGQP
jgi:hypothetical protein